MKPRTIAGIVLALSGIGMHGAAGLVMMTALDKKAATDDVLRRTEASCREQLVKLGRLQPRENGVLDLEMGEVKGDPRMSLADATSTLAMCPGRHIQDVCLGVACSGIPGPGGGVHLTVRLALGSGNTVAKKP